MPNTHADTFYDPDAIFDEVSPIDPWFIADSVQALMRAMPLNNKEPEGAKQRHLQSGLIALAATNPRDPIEVMLAVQAISAQQAASLCWRIGMNLRLPSGDSTRHISAACAAARTFDSMLRAMERRQAKPLAVSVGRPEPKVWTKGKAAKWLDSIAERIRRIDDQGTQDPKPDLSVTWTPEELAFADEMLERERIEEENKGLDIANTEGILPGGGMIMPEDPTPQQAAYMARRLGLMYKREYAENLKKGLKIIPKIKPLRTGDLIP